MHILIVDDEPPAARRVQRLIQEHFQEPVESLKILHGVEPAIYYLQEHPVDLVFLDLEIAENSGFDLLQSAARGSFHTIIVSGHPEGALQAFDHEVVDFVTKPVNPERFKKALERLRNAGSSRGVQRKSISLPVDDGTAIVDIDNIEFVRSDGNYCVLETYDNRQFRIRKSLAQMERELGSMFLRIHKSCIVREADIVHILSASNNTFLAELRSKKRLPLSRSVREDLRSGHP
ncbi:MAG: response regulator transcription factor [Leptospiraceae bacterium]|nr:response regulator transcription factor [Leptospiraceae bacterium]